jgi:aryl-alcohol dehydrogenase-like predicted oxidoreductase
MKSERVVGCALEYLTQVKGYSRNEFFISSKGGFIEEDADNEIHLSDSIRNVLEHPLRMLTYKYIMLRWGF